MPKPYERRVRETQSGNGKPYYVVEEWRHCDCPDCAVDYHWMQRGGYTDKAQAEAAAGQ